MAVFPLLADPESYRPHTIDMAADTAVRDYWLRVFEENRASMARCAVESVGGGREAESRAAAYREAFGEVLSSVRADPSAFGELSILRLCELRRACLLEHGFEDPYVHIKRRENEAALARLPGVLRDLDALDDAARWPRLIEHVFAGNIFDMGCSTTIALYEDGGMDFHATRDRLPARPWCVDDLDAWLERLDGPPHRKAVVFVDNAGADVVLGMIPLMRELLRRGTAVVATANTGPALNDVIHEELIELFDRTAGFDRMLADAWRDGRLIAVPSGNDKPVIDLRAVSDALAAAAADADLLVIEGMGRSLETNYDARFRCDTLKLAMIKEQDVADYLGGRLYDVVCRFEPIGAVA